MVGEFRRLAGMGEHVAGRDIDLAVEDERYGLFGGGFGKIAVHGDDARDRGGLAGGCDQNLVTHPDPARGDRTRKPAKIEIGTIDPLHGKTERGLRAVFIDSDIFEVGQKRRARVPWRALGLGDDVIAAQGRDGDCGKGGEAQFGNKGAVFGLDPCEHLLGIVHEIDLVDHQRHVLHPKQREDETVAARLGQKPLAGVDQQQRHVGVGGAGRHVAGVLLVAGRIGGDEISPVGGKEAIGHVDGDALLALGDETVDQQREIDALLAHMPVAAVLFQRRQLVVEDHLAVIEQSADERRLTIVHRAAGQEAQQRFAGLPGEPEVDIGIGGRSRGGALLIRNTPPASSFPWSRPDRRRSDALRARRSGCPVSP